MTSPIVAPANDLQNCPDCFTSTIHTAKPVGHLEIIHDVPVYITRGTASSNSTIIFLTDGFGFNLVNNKLLADQYASRTGLRVLMPKFLPNGGMPLVTMRLSQEMTASMPCWNLRRQARRLWACCKLMAILVPFSFRAKRLYPTVLAYVRAVRASLPLGAKLGIAGFCLGGHWSSRICGEPFHEGGDSHLIDAHFTAHPSGVSPDDMAAFARHFRVPFSLALGDRDVMMSVEQARKVETSLREVYREEPDRLQVETYENCGHGFALRADPSKQEENEGAERALEQAVLWFRRFLV